MYTREYNDDGRRIVIPESYGGTLLRDPPVDEGARAHADKATEKVDKNPWEREENSTEDLHKSDESVETFSFISKLPLGSFLSDIFKKANFSLQKIGTEEILIIATSAFLFFIKDGDKECAIMLLLLLFLG